MAGLDMLDQSYRQGWISPRYPYFCPTPTMADMESGLDMETIRANLRRILKQKDVKPTTLSLMVGSSKTLVKDLLEKTKDVQISTLQRLAGALDTDVANLLALPAVPIAGYIGAGGHVIFEDIGETLDPDNSVMRPPGISGFLVALVVRGDSMLPRYRDGDVIYIQRDHDGLLEEYLGEDCAVRLPTGETYLKQLVKGSEPDRYTLRSLNAADMENVEVEWATMVKFVMPGATRRAMAQFY